MIKNYIFDFGQVIVKFDTEYMTSVYVKEEENIKLVEQVVFDRLYWDRLDAGTITDTQVKEAICSRLPEYLHKNALAVYDNWYRNLPFVEGMKELLIKIKKKGGRLFLLSNISIGFAENYKSVPEIKEIFNLFDGLVFSGPIGLIKPERKIFEYLLNKYDLKKEECVFIDDNIANIAGAQKVGLKAYQFNGNVDELKVYYKNESEWDFL